MKLFWLPLVAVLMLILAMDWLIWHRLRRASARKDGAQPHEGATHKNAAPSKRAYCFLLSAVVLYALLAGALVAIRLQGALAMRLSMMLLCVFYLVQLTKALTLGIYAFSWIKCLKAGVKRFVRIAAWTCGGILLFNCAWGIFVTPYQVQVNRVTVKSSRLPQAFDGYRIVQFSDAHLSCYGTDTTFVAEFVDSINAQNPDLIVFTGDLVSRESTEAKPFVKPLSRLRARDGVYSIRGNHDMGIYNAWESADAREKDSILLCQLQAEMGWQMIEGEHRLLRRATDSIALIGTCYHMPGVEWTARLKAEMFSAYPNFADDTYKIVLQHTPSMWSWMRNLAHFDLMLSGHTHAMQMVVNVFGRRFSPASWMYDWWGGLYADGDQQLYVNTGMGEVGVPMRLGVAPEITVITLSPK